MKHLIAGAVTTALIATTSLTPVQAAPLSVAAGSTVTPQTTLTDVRYRAHRPIRRHVRRHYRGGNAMAAAALGLFVAALAGAIASSRYDDDYYYGPSYYYPSYGYGYSYGYARPRAYYRPGWGGGARFAGGGWRGGGFRGGGFHAGGGRIGGFRGGGFHGGGFHGGGHRH